MKAMIFAAGVGSRLRPFTLEHPKALAPVGGRPILERVVRNVVAARAEAVVVNVHHFADQIVQYLQENDNFGMDVRISNERSMLLETGGGLKKAAPLFDSSSPIFIHNVDILSTLDFNAFYGADLSPGARPNATSFSTARCALWAGSMPRQGKSRAVMRKSAAWRRR